MSSEKSGPLPSIVKTARNTKEILIAASLVLAAAGGIATFVLKTNEALRKLNNIGVRVDQVETVVVDGIDHIDRKVDRVSSGEPTQSLKEPASLTNARARVQLRKDGT